MPKCGFDELELINEEDLWFDSNKHRRSRLIPLNNYTCATTFPLIWYGAYVISLSSLVWVISQKTIGRHNSPDAGTHVSILVVIRVPEAGPLEHSSLGITVIDSSISRPDEFTIPH